MFELVLASDPDAVEVGPFSYDVKSVNYNVQYVTMNLEFRDVMNDEFPGLSFTPENTPGLF
jgi:hypothetical protein